MSQYSSLLRDPRWQKKRLEILERDDWACQICYDTETPLAIHHRFYDKTLKPWEYPDSALVTLCDGCHKEEYEQAPIADKALICAVHRAGFLSSDIHALACGIVETKMQHLSEVVACAFAHAFKTPAVQRLVLDEYLKTLSPGSNHRQAVQS